MKNTMTSLLLTPYSLILDRQYWHKWLVLQLSTRWSGGLAFRGRVIWNDSLGLCSRSSGHDKCWELSLGSGTAESHLWAHSPQRLAASPTHIHHLSLASPHLTLTAEFVKVKLCLWCDARSQYPKLSDWSRGGERSNNPGWLGSFLCYYDYFFLV